MTTTQTNVERARELLHFAADASKKLEESVRELVAMRAWEVLGHANFSEMWEKENGFTLPMHIKTLAVKCLMEEGMNTLVGAPARKYGKDGHTRVDIAIMVGMPVHVDKEGFAHAPHVGNLITQLDHGVPVDKVVNVGTVEKLKNRIDRFGTTTYQGRKRPQPRRMGAAPDELVPEGFSIPRRDADAIYDIARAADVPKSEIYRQAVAEYLARHRESRPGAVAS